MQNRATRAHKFFIIVLAMILAACSATPTPNPPTQTPVQTAQPTNYILQDGDSPVVISEIMAGIQGNNNYEYIELYNRSDQVVDLHGWAIWYRLAASQEDLFVYRWRETALIPPHGHYLLGHSGVDLTPAADVEFDQALNTTGGGLQLRLIDGTVIDRAGWGKAPEGFFEGEPAPALTNGTALERLPGASQGSWQNSGSSAADFRLITDPDPQNTASPLTPFANQRMEISLEMPGQVIPGDSFTAVLRVQNLTGSELKGVRAVLPIPADLEYEGSSANLIAENGNLIWDIDSLADGDLQDVVFELRAPWTYYTAVAANYSLQAENWPTIAYGGVARTIISGGSIPIATARTLQGAELTIEGTAVMYTGGYFAGNGNVKFYLQDDTGAIQVQVFGGAGLVNVRIGDRVRVRGEVSTYRDSIQIVPLVVPDDVEIIGSAGENEPSADLVDIPQAFDDRGLLPGSLVAIEGDVSRVDEFTYSYEIDVRDANYQALTLYVDKQTNINIEQIQPGMRLFAAGILDTRDGVNLLYPRIQEDLQERFPPVLRVVVSAPPNVDTGLVLQFSLEATNHTTIPQQNVIVSLPWTQDGKPEIISGSGVSFGELELTWTIPNLEANGGQQSIMLSYVNPLETGLIDLQPTIKSDNETGGSAAGKQIFIGETVPIWAIQGITYRSPFVGQVLAAQGVVTGVFPGLGGFFVQSDTPDADPASSDGLFIQCPLNSDGELIAPVNVGNLVRVTGKVREPGQQTTLEVSGAPSIEIISTDGPVIEPLLLDPPATEAEARTYYERLEGMLVTVPGPAVAVSPISKYGETVIIHERHGVERLYQGVDNGILMMVDDGKSSVYTSAEELPYVVNTGDTLSSIVGPLAYTFAMFKIEPIAPVSISSQLLNLPFLPTSSDETLSVMTWNVENLFDARQPNPTDPPMPNPREYRRALDKVAATIDSAGGPTIVALQEVENIGVLESLAAHEWLADYHYEPVLIEGSDSRGIDVGYLVRSERARIVNAEQKDAPDGVFSRPPLLLQVEVQTPSGAIMVFLINNHFTSMSGGELATEPRRTEQAAWNAGLASGLIKGGERYVVVLGDLNSYFKSPPIETLRQAGLQHVLDFIPATERYTYIYLGESQVLDHIMVSPDLYSVIQEVVVLHTNADYALPPSNDNGVLHKSDHDPVIATFMLK